MKKQVIVIHGGDAFDTYEEYLAFLKSYELDFQKLKLKRWKETLSEKLGENLEVVSPRMPNSMNAKYKEWKIMFEKLLPFLENNLMLVGHSLGGIFLAKYLSENDFPRKIVATFLVAAPYGEKGVDYSLGDFTLPKSLKGLQKQGGKIFIYHSKDDLIVPFADLGKYKNVLPEARIIIFEDRGHFDQTEFPELVRDIKNL